MLAVLRATLRDPLYRWEVRRYWTWRRYLWVALGILALSAAVMGFVLWSYFRVRRMMAMQSPSTGVQDWTAGQVLLLSGSALASVARFPLCVLTVVGAAMAVVPERRSGQLDQFMMTPVDPWRFALARMAGRFRGLFLVWLAIGVILTASLVLMSVENIPTLRARGLCPQALGLRILAAGITHLDLGLMLALDTVVGFGFSASSRTTARALTKSCLVSMVILPFVLFLPAIGLESVHSAYDSQEAREIAAAGGQVLAIALHTALGCGALVFFLRRARRTATRLFDDPEALP